MTKPRSKIVAYVFIGAVVAFLGIDLIAGFACPDMWAFDAAAAVCRRNGWQPGTWSSGQSKISAGLIGKIATIEFIPNDQSRCKTIRITLRKPINLMPWKVMDYTEVPSQP
jgi:hypothetical protein